MNKFLLYSKLIPIIAVIMVFLFESNNLIAQQNQIGAVEKYRKDMLEKHSKGAKEQIDKQIQSEINELKTEYRENNFQKSSLISSTETKVISESDSLILVTLYNSTNGSNWKNNTNWLTGPVSSWHGITIVSDSVTQIILKDNNLVGSIPTELGQLEKLQVLDLDTNRLSGVIPVELGQLKNLESLYLNGNKLTGSIPFELGELANLTLLFLNDNQLTGTIPTELNKLTKLEFLFLKRNQLTGTIPTELSQLTKLEFLDLGQNQLTGSIPIELAQLSNLKWLLLDNNQLTGTIPAELGQFQNLVLLYLFGNNITGSIPIELSQLTKLIYLDLSKNQLTGIIPTELVQLSNLSLLYLNGNQLAGSIPDELSQLTNLMYLNLGQNQFTGTIPTQLTQITNLALLYLGGNQLTGSIPAELGQLNELIWLDLGQNQLTDSIPEELMQLDSLSLLYLDGNQLTGNIPTDIVQLENLKWLFLDKNKLTGPIPSELTKLTNLQWLILDNNQLTGSIPAEITQLTNLYLLYLNGNQLTGSIPAEISKMANLQIMDINSNLLDSLPELTVSDSLVSFNISKNRFTFEDLEYNMDLSQSLDFIFSPQDSIGENQTITMEEGDHFSYAIITGGTQNGYQWYKNGEILDLQNSATLEINKLTTEDSGKYYCYISNTLVSGLTLESRELNLFVKASTLSCVKLKFAEGWNILSVNNMPDSMDAKHVFQSFIDNGSLVKIQDELGNSLEDWGIVDGWQNNMGDIWPSEGYKIKMNVEDSIEICGIPVQYPFAIPLKQGWNIIGYPLISNFDGMEVIQQLIDRAILTKVQDQKGNSIEDWGIDGSWQNNIGNFIPGEGYKVKVSSDDTLWVYDSYTSSFNQPEQFATIHFYPAYNGNGVDHMNINLVDLPLDYLQPGDELAIFDNLSCVGAITIMPHHLENQMISVVASAFDSQEMNGFVEDNPIILKLWKSKQNTEFVLSPEFLEGSSTFSKHETTFASLDKYITTSLKETEDQNLTKIKCYPNPFNDEVKVEIFISNEAEISIEVLNQIGQKVKSLTAARNFNRGTNLFRWDGKDIANQQVSSGIYFIKIMSENKIYFEKVVYRKNQ